MGRKLSQVERERLEVLKAERELHMDAVTGIDDEIAEIIQNARIQSAIPCPTCNRTSDVEQRPDGTIHCPMIHP